MNDLAGLIIVPAEFELLAAYCAKDGQFPTTWEGWAALVSSANAYALDAGFKYEPLRVNPSRFKEWCARVEIVPCIDALRAYAVSERSQSVSPEAYATSRDRASQ